MAKVYKSAAEALADKTPGSRAIQGTCAEAFKLAGITTKDVDGNTAWYCAPISQVPGQDMNDENSVWNVGVSRSEEANKSSIAATLKNYPELSPAIERLQAAIEEFKDIAGPVTFEAEDKGDMLMLTATYDAATEAQGQPLEDEPWTQFGGYKILERAGYDIGCGNAGMDSYTDRYGDAMVSQWVTFAK